MKKPLISMLLLLLLFSGCASPPIYIMDNFHGKKVTRCDSDMYCISETYSVTWDYTCQPYWYKYRNNCSPHCNNYNAGGYPVSYRSKAYSYENDPNGYAVTLPSGGNIATP